MVFNMTGNGGGLNFKVVQYATTPTGAAAENTIGVVTDTAITSWVMQAEQPTGAEGMVWIEVAAASDVAFYADKKQRVKLYPKSVKQYVDGAWTNTEAYVYQSGWVRFSSEMLWFYENGQMPVEWTFSSSYVVNTNNVKLGGQSVSGKMGTKDIVDLSSIRTLYIRYMKTREEYGDNVYTKFGVYSSSAAVGEKATRRLPTPNGAGVENACTLDVSEVDSGYICVSAVGQTNYDSTTYVYEVRGE